MQSDEDIILGLEARLAETERRLAECEFALGQARGSMRGIIDKLWFGDLETVRGIIERALHKSVTRYYRYPIPDEPADPTKVKR